MFKQVVQGDDGVFRIRRFNLLFGWEWFQRASDRHAPKWTLRDYATRYKSLDDARRDFPTAMPKDKRINI